MLRLTPRPTPTMPNVVFDASALVGALLKEGSIPERALLLARAHDTICLSDAVEAELRAVFFRPKFQRYLTPGCIELLFEFLKAAAIITQPTEPVTDCRDAKDNKYLELALAAGAETIVSSDFDARPVAGCSHHDARGLRGTLPSRLNPGAGCDLGADSDHPAPEVGDGPIPIHDSGRAPPPQRPRAGFVGGGEGADARLDRGFDAGAGGRHEVHDPRAVEAPRHDLTHQAGSVHGSGQDIRPRQLPAFSRQDRFHQALPVSEHIGCRRGLHRRRG